MQQSVKRKEARKSFKQEAMTSWLEYKKTGLHLTHKEVRDWLKSWGSDDEPSPPVCHTEL